ncbi:alpha/beta hydrolase [Sphingomonas sp. MG17]|uniref:Alpha/beta hydrolase n=1 Tax=Sphingomonas tagetis TaxID=2949092 RepID=A0A9X2HMX7_9SPHN|nr:alpha/beta hydrolase [Sphingomonas tagetis]MCP3731376.1 alpha/beta hydrolase [Sphingomonas tagetis]
MKEYTLDIGGIGYGCVEAGSGPLLLLCHGTFGGRQLMLPQLEWLSRSFRCVAFDWRGHGGSGYDPAGWTADDLVEDVATIIAALGERSAIIAGVSQGGAIGMRVALRYPEKVEALINMCGGPGAPPPAAIERISGFARIFAEERDEAVRRAAAIEFATGYFHAPDFIAHQQQRFAEEIDVILSHPRESVGLLPCVPASYVDITPRLGEIACPTLIVWASHEARLTLGSELAAAIPEARLVIIQDAGHHVNVDAPEATTAAIETFLRAVGQARTG